VGLNRDNDYFYEWTLPAPGPKPHAGAFAIFIKENAPGLFDGGADFQDCLFLQGLMPISIRRISCDTSHSAAASNIVRPGDLISY
jgi:hypothetical protein